MVVIFSRTVKYIFFCFGMKLPKEVTDELPKDRFDLITRKGIFQNVTFKVGKVSFGPFYRKLSILFSGSEVLLKCISSCAFFVVKPILSYKI